MNYTMIFNVTFFRLYRRTKEFCFFLLKSVLKGVTFDKQLSTTTILQTSVGTICNAVD